MRVEQYWDLPLDGPTPEPPTEPTLEPDDPAARGTSFEVVDEDGVPLRGSYRVGDREGVLAGVIAVEPVAPARLCVSIDGAP